MLDSLLSLYVSREGHVLNPFSFLLPSCVRVKRQCVDGVCVVYVCVCGGGIEKRVVQRAGHVQGASDGATHAQIRDAI